MASTNPWNLESRIIYLKREEKLRKYKLFNKMQNPFFWHIMQFKMNMVCYGTEMPSSLSNDETS